MQSLSELAPLSVLGDCERFVYKYIHSLLTRLDLVYGIILRSFSLSKRAINLEQRPIDLGHINLSHCSFLNTGTYTLFHAGW